MLPHGAPAAPIGSPALELSALHRGYRAGLGGCLATVRVLRGVTLRVQPGEVVGVVGAEGAGKTTLLLCAAGLLRPDGGTVAWPTAASVERGAGGTRAEDAPASVAFVPGLPRFYVRYTAREVLGGAGCDDRRGVEGVLESLGLDGAADVAVGWLPGDAVRRLAVARAVVSGARLLLLDEPLFGAAGPAASRLCAALRRYATRGGAVLVTAREREPIAALARRVVTLREGRLDDGDDARRPFVPARRDSRGGERRVAEGEPRPGAPWRVGSSGVDPPERRP